MADSDRSYAPSIFTGIAPQYSWMGAVMSFGQDGRWRRFMVSKVNAAPGSLVLDVAAGTGLVSRELAARKRLRVVSFDATEPMLRSGLPANELAGLDAQITPVLGRAERLPFPDETFDALTFTYLFRYVDDPAAAMRELARVVRARRDDRHLGVPRARAAVAAGRLVRLHARCPAGDRVAGGTRVARHRPVPRAQHQPVRRACAAPGAGSLVAGRRGAPRAIEGDVAGRRCRGVGREGRPRCPMNAPPSTR